LRLLPNICVYFVAEASLSRSRFDRTETTASEMRPYDTADGIRLLRKQSMVWNTDWENKVVRWVEIEMAMADPGHGIDHVRRVVINADRIALQEQANRSVVLPAAWLHDCVLIPKNSPQRSQASRMAAETAKRFLQSIEYPSDLVDPIAHCIVSHSFSAQVPCESLEAKIVQDADRLEAVGAIGIARCLMTGGSMRQRLYDPTDPFPTERMAEDNVQSIDHFFAKFFKLADTMQLAVERSLFMVQFLRQLAVELSVPQKSLDDAIRRVNPRLV
jgi:uncharacterized protein